MNIYIPLGIILVLITYLCRNNYRSSRSAFLIAFISVFVFAAIRYEFGPDYFSYREQFEQLKDLGFEGYLSTFTHFEEGFVVFFDLFNSYFMFIIVHTFIWLGVFYWLFSNTVHYRYLYVVILMLFIERNIGLLNYVAMRSTMADCFFFVGLICLTSNSIFDDFPVLNKFRFLKKIKHLNLIVYVLLILIGSTFHVSLVVLLVFALFASSHRLKKGNENTMLIVFYILAVISPLVITPLTRTVSEWMLQFSSEESLGRYARELESISTSGGGLGAIFFNVLRVMVATPILKALTIENDCKYIRLMHLSIVFLLAMLVIEGNVLARYNMCFYPVIVIALLRSFSLVNSQQRRISLLSLCLLSLFNFYQASHTSHFVSFLQYHTIFSAPWQ